jgi:dTDP-4-amino-4,6-dideoxy-D-galactose acyltransferase
VKAVEQPDTICTYLEWDSEFFGRRIARVTLNRVDQDTVHRLLAWSTANRIECLYFLADPEDSQTSKLAEANQFHLVDVRMTLERSLRENPPTSSSVGVRPAREQDVLALRTIARSAHRDTRFHFDQHFDRTKCDLLYEIWIEKSVSGFADMVFVAEIDGKPVAYITGHLRDDEVQIGLIGVDEAHQGKGLASILVQHLLAKATKDAARRATVVTQGRNVRAQRLYQRNGFVTVSCQLWYHRWFL